MRSDSRPVHGQELATGERLAVGLIGTIVDERGFHHSELHAFRDFGIPAAAVMEPIVGVLEILGGVLLVSYTLILPAATVLAVIMLVAFVAGGIIRASPIPSDTLAPASSPQ